SQRRRRYAAPPMAASTNSSGPSTMLNGVNPAAGAGNATAGAGDRTTASAVATTTISALRSGRLGRVAAKIFAGAPAFRTDAALAVGGAASGRLSSLAGGAAATMSGSTRGVETMAGTR